MRPNPRGRRLTVRTLTAGKLPGQSESSADGRRLMKGCIQYFVECHLTLTARIHDLMPPRMRLPSIFENLSMPAEPRNRVRSQYERLTYLARDSADEKQRLLRTRLDDLPIS